jgi:hypothetical protein
MRLVIPANIRIVHATGMFRWQQMTHERARQRGGGQRVSGGEKMGAAENIDCYT